MSAQASTAAQAGLQAKPSFTIKRRLKATPAKIYEAFTDPAKLTRWFGPGAVDCTDAKLDARVGGRYQISMRSPDGEDHVVGGVYREVAPAKKLVFTWAWRSTPERESLVTVDLKAEGDGTLLTLSHEQFFDAEARDRHQQGWSGGLDKLEKMFA